MPPPLPFVSIGSIKLNQSDSSNKSLMEPGSNQHLCRMACESMWVSCSLDNILSGYQTCSVPHNVWWLHLGLDWVSWEWHGLSRMFQCTQRASIKTARYQPHGFDLQWVVPATTQSSSQVCDLINSRYNISYHGRCQIEKMDDIWFWAMKVGACLYRTRDGT